MYNQGKIPPVGLAIQDLFEGTEIMQPSGYEAFVYFGNTLGDLLNKTGARKRGQILQSMRLSSLAGVNALNPQEMMRVYNFFRTTDEVNPVSIKQFAKLISDLLEMSTHTVGGYRSVFAKVLGAA